MDFQFWTAGLVAALVFLSALSARSEEAVARCKNTTVVVLPEQMSGAWKIPDRYDPVRPVPSEATLGLTGWENVNPQPLKIYQYHELNTCFKEAVKTGSTGTLYTYTLHGEGYYIDSVDEAYQFLLNSAGQRFVQVTHDEWGGTQIVHETTGWVPAK